MKEIAIRVEGLGKRYRIASLQRRHDTLKEALTYGAHDALQRLGRAWNRQPRQESTIWALRDLSFEVERGEVIGVIGANGAGKSTLLKILSRITEPTMGEAEVHGRVASLLEVGTGFHSELSGRENIYLNGAILGMRRAEINRKFDEIVAFAEVEQFIDTPVKHYSSGMYLRLAFAVAAHLEPEILIVDEVLAVGDASFQKKCLGKMGSVAGEGRTVLFVSHNMTAIQSLCHRALWLQGGQLVEDGPAPGVVSRYLTAAIETAQEKRWADPSLAPGNELVRMHSARVRPVGGTPSDPITIRTPFVLEFEYWNLRPGLQLSWSLQVFNEEGVMLFNTASVQESVWHGRPFPDGLFRSECCVPGDLLNDGLHRIRLLAVRDEGTLFYTFNDILAFDVQNVVSHTTGWQGKWPGAVRPFLQWSTEQIEAQAHSPAGARR